MQRGQFKQKPPEFGVHLRAAALEKPAVRVIQGNDGRPASRVSLLVDCTKPVAVAPGRATTADIRSHMADIKTIKEKGLDLNKVARDAAITASVDKAVVPAGSATPEHVTTLIERGLKAQAPVPTPGSDSPLRCAAATTEPPSISSRQNSSSLPWSSAAERLFSNSVNRGSLLSTPRSRDLRAPLPSP